MAWADSITPRKVTRAALSDSWGTLADSTAARRKFFVGLQDTLSLNDSIAGRLPYRASFQDGFEEVVYLVNSSGNQIVNGAGNPIVLLFTANTWSDLVAKTLGVPAATTPKTFSGTDALNLWNDLLAGRLVFRVAVTDPWNNLVNSAIQFRKGLYKFALTDPWGNLSDTLAGLRREQVGLSDSALNLADSVAQFRKGFHQLSLTDPWGNLADSLAAREKFLVGLTDTLNFWNDLVAKTLTIGLTPLTFSATDVLSMADTLAGFLRYRSQLSDSALNLADSLAGRRGERVGLTDPWNNLVDSAIQFRQGLYKLALTDPWGNLADSLAGFRRERAGLTDSAANLADSIAGFRRMRLALQDSMTQADSLRALFKYRAQFTDSAANLADLLTLFLLSPNLRLQMTDSWGNLSDMVQVREKLMAALSDDGRNLADAVDALLQTAAGAGAGRKVRIWGGGFRNR